MIKVLKFGGSSQLVSTYQLIKNIINDNKDTKFVIVLSAVKNITNKLIEFVNTKNYTIWNDIISINEKLSIDTNNYCIDFIEKNKSIQWNFDKDCVEIISIGEFFTTQILNEYLNNNNIKSKWISSYDVIKSNQDNIGISNKGEFNVNSNIILDSLDNHQVVIIPGFSGSTFMNQPCLLGRGGSDTTGSIIASAIDADDYEIWTDVNGIYSSDPRKIKNTFIIPSIDYNSAQEIAAMGGKVIHPFCILPCAQKNIPIIIKNTFEPNNTNTTKIHKDFSKNNIYAIGLQDNVKVFKITSLNMWNNYGFVFDIFSVFKKYNIDVNIINTSQFNITTTTDDTNIHNLQNVKNELEQKYSVELDFNNTIVNVVGYNIKSYDKIGKIFDITTKYNIITTSYSSNDMTLSFVVKDKDAINLAQEIHNLVFEKHQFILSNKWWTNYIDYIKDINEPTYVYSKNIISQQINKIKKLSCVDKYYYSMKANNNKELLNFIINNDFGIECVSIEELIYITNNFPNCSILFTPNFCNIQDYIQAFELQRNGHYNMKIIIDNCNLIKHHPSVFIDQNIGIRLDIDIKDGHSNKVITQGKESKFGMTISDFESIQLLLRLQNVNVEGFHCHIGSGIHNLDKYIQAYSILNKLGLEYNVKWIDIGGGFGVKNELDFDYLNKQLSDIKYNNNKYEKIKLFVEPGRFIVANSGIIVGKVNQLKTKNDVNYIGINIGMNNLIRPTLYNAIHPIYFPLSKTSNHDNLYKVVGSICESGDVFIDNLIIKQIVNENDLVIIEESGAYGEVMSSNYNMKKNGQSIIIDENINIKIINNI